MTPINVDFEVPYNKKLHTVRVVVVKSQKELIQLVQSLAWFIKDETMYEVGKSLHGATYALHPGPITICMCRDLLTWEVISHEVAHVAHYIVDDGKEEAIAHIVGDLTHSIGKELKANGAKILL